MSNLDGAYLVLLVALVLIWSGYALSLGHNGTIIASVFTFVGVVAGYIYGKRKN